MKLDRNILDRLGLAELDLEKPVNGKARKSDSLRRRGQRCGTTTGSGVAIDVETRTDRLGRTRRVRRTVPVPLPDGWNDRRLASAQADASSARIATIGVLASVARARDVAAVPVATVSRAWGADNAIEADTATLAKELSERGAVVAPRGFLPGGQSRADGRSTMARALHPCDASRLAEERVLARHAAARAAHVAIAEAQQDALDERRNRRMLAEREAARATALAAK